MTTFRGIAELDNWHRLVAWAGHIPEALGELSNLWVLNLQGNNLTGSIPEALGNLNNLRALDLQGNNLLGEYCINRSWLEARPGLRVLYSPSWEEKRSKQTKNTRSTGFQSIQLLSSRRNQPQF